MRRAAPLCAALLLCALLLAGCGSEMYVVRTETPLPGGMTLEDYNARYHPEPVVPTPPAGYAPTQPSSRSVPDPDTTEEPETTPEPIALPAAEPEPTPAPVEAESPEDPEEFYVYSAAMLDVGGGKYHRADGACWARDNIESENYRTGTRSECEALGLTPCGVCKP